MKSYLINSFYFQYSLFKAHLGEHFDFTFTPPLTQSNERALTYVWRNWRLLKKMYASGQMKKFDVVHFNRAEGYLAFEKYPSQISIFEIHGFDVGVRGKDYLKDLHTPWKVWLGSLIDKRIEKKIIEQLQKPDILYVSTPDLVEPIRQWCGRTPQWLPNPIDTKQFTPDGPVKKLEGSPAVLLAARLHGDKKPEVAFNIFKTTILPKYPNAVLHLLSTGELVDKYKNETAHDPHYAWLPYMDKATLASVIRGTDLVFGDFSIGALSMLPMQVMLCKKPIVTLDNYEVVKTPVEKMPELTLRLLADENFKNQTIEKNYSHVIKTHSPDVICKTHLQNLKKYMGAQPAATPTNI